MKVLVLVIVSFDKPVYYDMLAVWKKRINDLTITDATDVWFIQCKPESEWVGDIVNDLSEPSSTALNENSFNQSLTLNQSLMLNQSQKSLTLNQSLTLKNRFELDILNKTLYVRGDECLIPGILHKTVEALSYFLSVDSSYSYVWRTNLSSVLDFAGLERYLGTISSTKALSVGTTSLYAGYVGLGSLNNGSKVNPDSLSSFFASGAGFLMSRDVALYLIENKEFLRWDLIDDVAIGALLEPKYGIVPLDRCWVQSGDEDISALVSSGIFHFRCESYQHLRTVEFMRYVDECLLRGFVP